jgi:precorrin-2 C20-methyltransferase/precorrin-3B C17-methyltransferase
MGQFWAVGVGPGDPELLTVKAVNVLRSADVIYHAGPRPDQGRGWETIRHLVRPDQEVRTIRTASMREVRAIEAKAAYGAAIDQIAADCRRGRTVAFVTEGDPTVYSSAAAVCQLLAEMHPDVPVTVVPGVSSITAAAARVGWPLGQKDERLAIVPAVYQSRDLRALLENFSTVCFLKVPAVLPGLTEALRLFGSDHEAVYVENLGTSREWLTHDLAKASGREEYFALVLVRKSPRAKPTAEARRSEGGIWVVGLGPGDPRSLTPQARSILQDVDIVLGYDGYLRSLDVLGLRAERRGSPIGAETERAAEAVKLAREGQRVALVSSGDAGVYGMASLLLESAEKVPGLEIEIIPGVTAAVAAASLLGAPLGHDFACVSLSDLLTPWEVIEGRLEAAGRGDFVLALYNPLSSRRTWQLPGARDILLRYRDPETPVGLVDKAYRPGQRVWQTTLAGLTTEGVGMETTLIVGSSRTRVVNGRLVTPRGYGERQ